MSKIFAASFASLMGYGSKAKGSSAEDEIDDEKDPKGKGKAKGEGEDDKGGDDKEPKGKAKGEGDDDKGDDDKDPKGKAKGEGDDDKEPKSKAKGKADGDDDDGGTDAEDEEDDDAAESDSDGDDKKDAKSQKAAKTERQRCARIISYGIKCGRVEQAGVFAFDTGMSSAAAIGALNAAGSFASGSKSGGLRERMSAAPEVTKVKADAAPQGGTLADQIIQAGKLRRGEQ